MRLLCLGQEALVMILPQLPSEDHLDLECAVLFLHGTVRERRETGRERSERETDRERQRDMTETEGGTYSLWFKRKAISNGTRFIQGGLCANEHALGGEGVVAIGALFDGSSKLCTTARAFFHTILGLTSSIGRSSDLLIAA
jgi:hypothetical protein